MGLRFRKSVSLFPGVRLNFGKTGMSVSAGVPGFRKTIHTSGKVTTSVGIPGTGIYYVDTKNPNSQRKRSNSRSTQQAEQTYIPETPREAATPVEQSYITEEHYTAPTPVEQPVVVSQIDTAAVTAIHKTSDDTIDWTEMLVSAIPPDASYNAEMWRYYHEFAPKVLSGDIDTYLQLIYEVNPLDDLLAYGGNFEFGTDNAQKIEVEFSVNESALISAKRQLNSVQYNLLLQDFVCSVCIRIARDMFALLPINHVIVHAVMNGDTVVSVDFDRAKLSKVKFGYIDPSDTVSTFNCRMSFTENGGFSAVNQLE